MTEPFEFFIDRSLGRHQVPRALRAAGLTVHTMAEVYGEQAGQRLKDEVWLEDVGRRGWIVLMKDDAIRRRPAERAAVIASAVRAFCLTNAQLRGAQQAERLVANRHRIIAQAHNAGPYIFGVHADRIARLWPR
jgi:hypothetical protein